MLSPTCSLAFLFSHVLRRGWKGHRIHSLRSYKKEDGRGDSHLHANRHLGTHSKRCLEAGGLGQIDRALGMEWSG
jgi:hypothetical protein